jgi:uncharacterized protein YcbX
MTAMRIEGRLSALHRYPVKSMQGEEMDTVLVTERGIYGDRAFALIDTETGKVASAKNPRKWPGLFDYHAAYTSLGNGNGTSSSVRITLPGGGEVMSDAPDVATVLSNALGRPVTIAGSPPKQGTLEEYWPDLEELPHRDAVTDEAMPSGTFFDCALVHLLTTATLKKLQELYPDGRFDVARFRPNILIESDEDGFAENAWIGRTLAIGDNVRLNIYGGTPRCVMTTLPQADLPQDTNILKTAAMHNGAHIGVYATVVQTGPISLGDAVYLE